jgi:hypothetical protein
MRRTRRTAVVTIDLPVTRWLATKHRLPKKGLGRRSLSALLVLAALSASVLVGAIDAPWSMDGVRSERALRPLEYAEE